MDHEAYPERKAHLNKGPDSHITSHGADLPVSTDAFKKSIYRKWDELTLDKDTNPFFYVEDTKELIDDSLAYGILKTKNEAIFKIYQSIKPGIPFDREICIYHDVDGILKRITQYGEFCKSAGQVTWRKNIYKYQTSTRIRCYTCNGVGSISNRCVERGAFNGKGRQISYQGSHQRQDYEKNKPKNHVR
ncbi:LAQU0S05e06590g1_1 [Lachancea quebecensis]|uniref:LAQU0S05e06590g1_1 n=1 Tax=Lachancea quebecensis TaxID=1654605 RepID=A0A0P1KRV9_9SACH|nr:LAQU0S05e06590g1_1 [Lachancea quebecensis]